MDMYFYKLWINNTYFNQFIWILNYYQFDEINAVNILKKLLPFSFNLH